MKKILSILVIVAMLLAALCVSASAGAYFERNGEGSMDYKDAKFQIKKSSVVKIDGIISDGEYEEFTGHCEWWIGEMASDAYADAQKLAETAKWYFSWDGTKYFHVAAVYDAGKGSNQTHAAGDFYGDYNVDESERIMADDFLAWGPGMMVVSAEPSIYDWSRFYFAIGENNNGGYMTGTFSDQNGQTGSPYQPVGGSDFDFGYNGSIVTVEWKIPVYQLNEKFVEGVTATTNFKCSISIHAGLYDGAQEVESSAAAYNYGVRLGLRGYNADSTLEDMGHATFVLTKNEIPAPSNPGTTTQPGTTEPGATTQPGTTEPGVTTQPGATEPGVTTQPGTTEPGVTTQPGTTEPGVTTQPGTTEPGVTTQPGTTEQPGTTQPGTTQPSTKPGNNVTAPTTADPMIIAAVVSALSACGVMIAKKRK